MIWLQITPLLLLAIGAFFLSWKWNIGLFILMFIVLSITEKGKIFRYLKNLFYLMLFTLPILIMKLIALHSGLRIHLFIFDIYSDGMQAAGEALIRIMILSQTAFIIADRLMEKMRKSDKNKAHNFVSIFLISIELYQNLISSMIGSWKKWGKDRLPDKLDQIYEKMFRSKKDPD